MRKTLALLTATLLSLQCLAIEPEPDWQKRYEQIKAEELAKSPSPAVGDQITVVRRVGGEFSGRISAIGSNSVTIGSSSFRDSQLTPDTCDKLFPEQYVSRIARQRVIDERADSLSRKQEDLRNQQISAARQERGREKQAAQDRLHQDAERRRATEAERVAAQQETARQTAKAATTFGVGFILLCIVGFFLYILPAFIAFRRGHQNAGAILVLNLLLGWSFLGWVAALVWSLTQVNSPAGQKRR